MIKWYSYMPQAMPRKQDPQTDGTTERVNQEIEAYLSIYCASHPEEWPQALHTWNSLTIIDVMLTGRIPHLNLCLANLLWQSLCLSKIQSILL